RRVREAGAAAGPAAAMRPAQRGRSPVGVGATARCTLVAPSPAPMGAAPLPEHPSPHPIRLEPGAERTIPMPRLVARRAGPSGWAVPAPRAAAALARAAGADPPDPKANPPSGAAAESSSQPKTLTGDDARRVNELDKSIDDLWGAGKFAEAVEPARQAA